MLLCLFESWLSSSMSSVLFFAFIVFASVRVSVSAQDQQDRVRGMAGVYEMSNADRDKICPVTKNKAEAECAWVVQGQRYEFCCPPCLDKFMRWAHNEPEKVKNANEYVFKGM